mmetsp:Transcript_22553/g.33400  ORF Transcript_22553/g.33400 Transcript_22553/m.33400 type:complete len:623 (+) Transcript_22553:138-2006(+)
MATDNKYDRQLRLWGANGQKKLSESCIVLVNATAAGTETLKNLVLPGIGRFHIIDDSPGPTSSGNENENEKESEPFSNFFVFDSHSKQGENVDGGSNRSRAEIATKHLSELNPDVTGSFTAVESLESADYSSILSSLDQNHSNLLVVAADLPSSILQTISSLCWNGLDPDTDTDTDTGASTSIPLLIVKSYGLIGSVRLQTPHHPIVESKPDNANADLRLASTSVHPDSFPELNALKDSINLESLESHEHNHVPYVIILLKAMDLWRKQVAMASETGTGIGKEEANTRLPKTFAEKNEFRKVLASMARNMNQELNFIEADKNYYMAYTKLDMEEVQELIDSVEDRIRVRSKVNPAVVDNKLMCTFDVLLLALKKFMLAHQGFPPLNGSIPDMAASTQGYIELQGIYKNKAQKDKEEMQHVIHAIGQEYGNGTNVIPNVSDEELTIFCKNIYNIRLTKTRSYQQEYTFDFGDEKDEIMGEIAEATYDAYEVPDQTPLLWFIALRACDAFYDQHGHYPGQDGRELALESDTNDVQKHIVDIVEKLGLSENELVQSTLLSKEEEKKNAYAKEMTRYNNAEVHNIASVVGGVASQEAVKMITGQYVPIDGNYIFNGIAGVAGIFKL